MPVLDGFEVTRGLRQLPELKDVVAIALSADVFESTKQKSLAAGCQDFLPKPVQAELLLESVMVHLRLEGIYEEPLHSREVEPNLCAAPVVPPPQRRSPPYLNWSKWAILQAFSTKPLSWNNWIINSCRYYDSKQRREA